MKPLGTPPANAPWQTRRDAPRRRSPTGRTVERAEEGPTEQTAQPGESRQQGSQFEYRSHPYYRHRQALGAENAAVFNLPPLRTCTLGINLMDCIANTPSETLANVKAKIQSYVPPFSSAVQSALGDDAGLLQTIRVTLTPMETLLRNAISTKSMTTPEIARFVAEVEQAIAAAINTNNISDGLFIGGAGMVGDYGITAERLPYLEAIPAILAATQYFFVDLVIGSSKSGIHLDSLNAVADVISVVAFQDGLTSERAFHDPDDPTHWTWLSPSQEASFLQTKQSIQSKWSLATVWPYYSNLSRLSVFVNAPQDNPYLAGGFAGHSLPEVTVSIGINGAFEIQQAITGVMGSGAATMAYC